MGLKLTQNQDRLYLEWWKLNTPYKKERKKETEFYEL